MMKKNQIKLDAFEQKIEDSENFQPLSSKNKIKLNAILDHAKKSKNINIRINEYDLEIIKEQSSKEGLPYQTFISSILHKYITNQLIDENAVLKTLRILKHHS